jgi:hypothetical protein
MSEIKASRPAQRVEDAATTPYTTARKWALCSLIVAAAMAAGFIVVARIDNGPVVGPSAIKEMVVFFLAFPSVLLFFPMIGANVHGFWTGYMWLAIGLNWVLYTICLSSLLAMYRRRRVRRLNRSEP